MTRKEFYLTKCTGMGKDNKALVQVLEVSKKIGKEHVIVNGVFEYCKITLFRILEGYDDNLCKYRTYEATQVGEEQEIFFEMIDWIKFI